MKKLKKVTSLIIVLMLVIFILPNCLYIFNYNEYAVKKQFGKIIKVEKGGGLKYKTPFITSIQILPNKVLFYDVPPTEVTTLDKKRIKVDYYILWKIVDPVKMIETLKTVEASEDRLGDILYSEVRNELGKLEYGSIINPEDNNRGNVDKLVKDDINKNLKENETGIELVDIQMKKIDLPDANEESVYKRMISERESKAQEYLSQGEAKKLEIIAKTDQEVRERIAKAKAKASKIVSEGIDEAQNIKNESYKKSYELFNLYKNLESYKQVIDGKTKIILPIDSPYLKYLR